MFDICMRPTSEHSPDRTLDQGCEIDCWRNFAVLHGDERAAKLATACALGMAI